MDQQSKRTHFSTTVNNVVYRISSYQNRISDGGQVAREVHNHFYIEFHYVFKGKEQIETFCDGIPSRYELGEGEMCVIPKGLFHGIHSDSVERFCFSINIEYREDTEYRELCRIRELYDGIGECRILKDAYIDGVMNQWRALSGEKGRFSKTMLGTTLLCAVFRAFDILLPQQEGSGDEVGNEALMLRRKWIIEEYISDRYRSNAGISALAKMLYLSERQTGTVVKELMGSDYKSLIVQRRMQLASILLRDESLSIEEIADAVGYTSYSGFYLAYTKYYGISPKDARKRLLEELASQ